MIHYRCKRARLVVFAITLSVATHAQVPSRNTNMVSGTTWPAGDPFLQRQNEPSIAASTRNPLHLFAGANDYRTVDLPGLPDGKVVGDAWLGLFKSFDGGERWQSTLLPGYPQDVSPEGMASPLKGFEAGADPTVRAGTNGLFYYSGIVFNRGENEPGAVFVSRFIDLNNKEGAAFDIEQNRDPIRYIDAALVDTGNSGQFMDKPWLAVDVPRAGAQTCSITVLQDGESVEQSFAGGNVYLAYSVFVGNDQVIRTKILFSRSTDCGATWSSPTKISEGYPINQGTSIAIDPTTGAVYVAWRRYATSSQTHAMMIAKSTDGGRTFTKAVEVADVVPFEQGTSRVSFRTNDFPSVTVDAGGRVYMVWTQRGLGVSSDARIVMTTSADGLSWPAPYPVDDPPGRRGHQLMPSLSFAQGKLTLVYYDLRLDHTARVLEPSEDGSFDEVREPKGDLELGNEANVFNDFVADAAPPSFDPFLDPLLRRHTIDVRAAQAEPGPTPEFTSYASGKSSVGVSRFTYGSRPHSPLIEQLQFNPPNLPLFRLGIVPFIGDYVDVTGSPAFVPNPDGSWRYNTAPASSPVFHAVWTDNRDVRPPLDGDWTNYTPPQSTGGISLFDPTLQTPQCIAGQAGMRNQNVYSARLTGGLVVGSLGNTKPLGEVSFPNGTVGLIQRAFTVFVQNGTEEIRSYRLSIVQQPPGGRASFLQFAFLDELDASLAPLSSASRTVYVSSPDPDASVTITVQEVDAPGGLPLPPTSGGLQATLVLNPDITNPDITNPDITNPDITNTEVYNPSLTSVRNPDITNPDITNPDITNPDITNPDITNPDITNVELANPDITNPDITNPDITNPDITNPDITNPDITNPDITNGSITDATWEVTNRGNTSATYAIRNLIDGRVPEGFKLQLIVHKVYTTPVAVDCELRVETQNILVVNVPNPVFAKDVSEIASPDITNPDITNTTVSLAPGESARITLRILDPDRFDAITAEDDVLPQVTATATAESVNTEDVLAGITQPRFAASRLLITTTTLPVAVVGSSYSYMLQATGGTGALNWSIVVGALPSGLLLDESTGRISGTPSTAGKFAFTVQVQDSNLASDTRDLSITVAPTGAASLFFVTQPSTVAFGETISPPVSVLALDSTGAVVPGLDIGVAIETNPAGGTLSGTTLARTGPSGVAIFGDLSIHKPGAGYTLFAETEAAGFASVTSSPFDVTAIIHLWSNHFGGTGPDQGRTLAVDANGDMFVTGEFQGTVDLGGGPLTSAGSFDILIAKFAGADGSHVWSKHFGATSDDRGFSVAVDANGDVFITGWFAGTVDFGGVPLTSASATPDIFIAKFSGADGSHLWSTRFGNAGHDRGFGLALDANGDLFATGQFDGTVDFGGGPITASIFIAKFSGADGFHIWSEGLGGPGSGRGLAVALDANADLLVTGDFVTTVDFGGGPITSAGQTDIFIAKFSGADGSHFWSKRFGGTGGDVGLAVVTDSSGDVFATGHFQDTVDCGGGPLTSAGSDDIFVAKFSAADGSHLWSKRFGDTSFDRGFAVALDANGDVFATGVFRGTADFGGGPLTSAGFQDIFIAEFSGADGSHVRSAHFGDGNGNSIALDANGDLFVTGFFGGTVDFGGGPLTSTGSSDFFLIKLR